MTRASASSLLLAMCLSPLIAQGASHSAPGPTGGAKRRDDNTPRQAFESAIRERKRVIVAMIAVVEDAKLRERNPKAISCAIRLLGELRAAEAVGVLVRFVMFRDDWSTLPVLLPREENFPTVDALIKIGKPAERALLRMLSERTVGKTDSSLAGYIIRQIEGRSELSLAVVKAYAEKLPPEAADRLLHNSVLLESLKD